MIGDVETMGRVNAFLRREAYGRALPLLESLRERNPQSGHLLLLSGKTGRMAEMAVVAGKLETVCFYRIATSKRVLIAGYPR